MKLLLDENLPKRLKKDFPEHEVFTARERRWNGIKNGELLQLMISDGFDALLTFDKNLQHQQNFSTYSIAVIVLTATINTYEELTKLSDTVRKYLSKEKLPVGSVIIKFT